MFKSGQSNFIGECSKENSAEKWDEVIDLAKDKIKTLETAIGAFERFKANGDPFPSTPKESEKAA